MRVDFLNKTASVKIFYAQKLVMDKLFDHKKFLIDSFEPYNILNIECFFVLVKTKINE